MKKKQRLEQGIFVLMKFLNGKIERKPSKIRSMGRWRDTEKRGGGVQSQTPITSP